jgi:cell division protein FtsI/penicillin-binding protein 2
MATSEGQDINRRIEFVYFVFITVLVIFVVRLFFMQVIQYSFFKKHAVSQQSETIKQQIGRGTIYTADNKKAAVSIKTFAISADPEQVKNKAGVADYLSKQLGISRGEIMSKLALRKKFVYLARKVDSEKAEGILERDLPGLNLEPEEKRYYPLHETAASLVGFTGLDNTGLEGIEESFEKYLRGKMGSVLIRKDAKGRPILTDTVSVKKAEAGADIYLTIDSNIEYYAQQELKNAVEKYKGKTGMLISMNPNTGAIYALANYPYFDPNDFDKYPAETRKNRVVTDVFEPGSTFKIFTMSAVLEDRPAVYDEKVHCGDGKMVFFDRTIHDHEKHGWLTVPEVIKYSSNIGMVELALRVKPEKLYNEYTKFGFGKTSGTDLPGEVPGILRPYAQWDNATLSSIPYGQEVAVTAVQLIRAYAALANGGYLVTPYVVEKIKKNGSTIYENKAGNGAKVVDNATRTKLVDMLKMVMEKDGTGKKGVITGYNVAGKTGTAQKHNPKGKGYAPGKYVCSFIGFFPADKPEVVTMVLVDEPAEIWAFGGDVAAPAFKNLSNTMISSMHILPDGTKETVQVAAKTDKTIDSKLPDFSMKQFSEAKKFMADNDIKYERIGFGKIVIKQKPEPKKTVQPSEVVSVYLGDLGKNKEIRIYMPDVRGFSIRKAMEVLSIYGLKAKCTGSGLATAQDPKPGVALKAGTECKINFEVKDGAI